MNVPLMTSLVAARRASVRRSGAALATLALLASAPTLAQVSAAPPCSAAPPGSGAAAASPEELSSYVRNITQSTRFPSDGLARWRTPICFQVEGVPENEAGFVAARLAQVASCAGAQVRTQGCAGHAYNFHVIFSLNADQVARDWYDRHLRLFNKNASRAQVEQFLSPPRAGPVRVWHDAMPFGKDGFPLIPLDPGSPSEPMPYQNFQYDGGSRLTDEAVTGLSFALVIIDGRLANGASLAQLTDYAAMVGLADLDLQANLGADPTILRLFSAPAEARPGGLTSWDEAFLSALYHTEQRSRTQRSQITTTMARNIAP